jgi:hypothetical protein
MHKETGVFLNKGWMKCTRLFFLMIMAFSITSMATDLYVATTGDDNAAGTALAQYKTLYKAKSVVRQMVTSALIPSPTRRRVP